jgi:hypothetical protein
VTSSSSELHPEYFDDPSAVRSEGAIRVGVKGPQGDASSFLEGRGIPEYLLKKL